MTSLQVAETFLAGHIGKSRDTISTGEKLFHKGVLMAQRLADRPDVFLFNATRYTKWTPSFHTKAHEFLLDFALVIFDVVRVNAGAADLQRYMNNFQKRYLGQEALV